jgi:glycerophosphoryl diester phosphodiesterase
MKLPARTPQHVCSPQTGSGSPDETADLNVQVVSHRGLSGQEPENSLAAFRAAVARGVEAIEFDVRQTLNGVVVVAHDAEVAGLSIGQTGYEQLSAEASELCTFAEALAAIPLRCRLDIEIKTPGIEEAVLRELGGARSSDEYVITSFYDQAIARTKALDPTVRVGLLLGQENPRHRLQTRLSELYPAARLRSCGADFVAPHWQLLRLGFLRRMRRLGYPVWVWAVNSTALLETLMHRPEVGAVITDHPLEAVRLRDDGLFLSS